MKIIVDAVSNIGLSQDLVIDFYTKNWLKPIALCDKKFYEWQFKSIPSLQGIDNCIVAYDAIINQVVGVMGLNQRPFYLKGEIVKGAELSTWIIHRSYQGAGLGLKMIKKIKDNYDVLLGMGITEAALYIYLMSGFRYLCSVPRFVKVFNTQSIKNYFVLKPLAAKMINIWSKEEKVNKKNQYSVLEGSFDSYDLFFNNISQKYNMFSRASKYLKWRYIEHPVYQYRIFLISSLEAGCKALVCLRIEDSLNNLKILHVMDCIGDEDAMPLAFSFIENFCKEEGIDAADFFCTAAHINKFPLNYGWFSSLDDRFFDFPHLFHPIKMVNPPTTSVIYWSKQSFNDLCDFSNLYITKQDCDFDRPVYELCKKTI